MTTRQKSDQEHYRGFVLAFEPKRTEKVAWQLESIGHASESFSAMDWAFEPREVVFLVLDADGLALSGAALMERMYGSGGTGKLMMRLRDPVLFDEPIAPESLGDGIALSENVSTAEQLKRIRIALWRSLVAAVKRLRPKSAGPLDELFAKRLEDQRLFGASVRIDRLVEERDAVGLALDIANLDRRETLRGLSLRRVDEAGSVLDLLDAEPVHEQDLIRHDQGVFEEHLNESMRNGEFYGAGGRAVRVYVYDKKAIETVLGIDLLIYQEVYRSFLLLQYKAMERNVGPPAATWSYLMDGQGHKQIDAMDVAEAAIQRQPRDEGDIWDWRLHQSPFYFKFCERTRPRSRDESLVSGITLGLRHLKHFLTQRLPEGEIERRIGYHNCPRYLNNTQFVQLAREGWIGCGRQGFGLISQVLKANEQGGRRAMLALIAGASEGAPATDARKRGWRQK